MRWPAAALLGISALVTTQTVTAPQALAVTSAAEVTSTGTWTIAAPSGLKRQEVTYTAVGGKLYLAGGRSTVQQVFDPATGTWGRVAPLPEALDHIQAVALDGAIYYVGGLTGYPQGASFGNVYVYHPDGDYFSTAAPLPTGRDRGAGGIGVYQGRIYLAGGFHAGHSVAFVDSYDPATDAWTQRADLPGPRDHASTAVVGDRMYVIGGRQFGVAFRGDNDAYDFATATWVTGLASLPTLRSGAATAVFGTEIAVIGGEGGGAGTGAHVDNEAYDTVTDSWRVLAPMPTARHGIQAAMDNGTAYVADGGTQVGGRSPTDAQEAFAMGPPPPSQPDCRVRLASETAVTGDNVYGTDGTAQTRSTRGADTTTTFVLSAQNDAAATDTLRLAGSGSQPGFLVRYLAGVRGTTDVTTAVVAGRYRPATLAPGTRQALRLEVTVAAGTATGSAARWLLSATSTSSGVQDVCGAAVSVP